MRKFICLFLCVILALSCVGCKNKVENIEPPEVEMPQYNPETTPPKEVVPNFTKPEDQYVTDSDGQLTEIRNNGYLPNSINDMTDEELTYHFDSMINAVLTLDLVKLKEYSLNSGDFKCFDQIADRENFKSTYLNRMSSVIYLSDSRYFVYKDPKIMYLAWRAECSTNELEQQTLLDVNLVPDIANDYASESKYIAVKIPSHMSEPTLKNGRIYFDLQNIMSLLGYSNLTQIVPSFPSGLSYLSFGFEGIYAIYPSRQSEAGQMFWYSLMDQDLDRMVDYVENYASYDLKTSNKESSYDDCYQLYYQDENNRKIVDAWMSDNVISYVGEYGIYNYVKCDHLCEDSWPFNTFTNFEMEQIKNLDIYEKVLINEIGDMSEWHVYHVIIEQMIWSDAIEDLYVK